MDIKDIVKKVKQIEIRTKRSTDAMLMGQYHSAFKGQGMTFLKSDNTSLEMISEELTGIKQHVSASLM